VPGVAQRVNQVSGKLHRGRHTTRHVELFELPTGGLLADTPGFNQPDLEIEAAQLIFHFPEARRLLETGLCQFNDCSHREEPNCVVRSSWERYEHYLKFLEEAIQQAIAQQARGEEESGLKSMTKESGKQEDEPKLAKKKYRQTSRRIKHQQLHELYHEQSARSEDDEDLEEWATLFLRRRLYRVIGGDRFFINGYKNLWILNKACNFNGFLNG
jgi:ribosome biogenesis GTPase / thiamine phosphate phosphatase